MNRIQQIRQRKQRGARPHGHEQKKKAPVPESSGGDREDPGLFPQTEAEVVEEPSPFTGYNQPAEEPCPATDPAASDSPEE